MSKVRTVAAISIVVGDAIVSGIIIGSTEMVIDKIDDCDKLSDTQKIFLKVACWVGSGVVLCTVPVTAGAVLRWPHRGV